MSPSSADLLRQLLPRYFWLRDAEDGNGVLAALVGSLADQYDALSDEIDRLYDDVFLVTCDPRYVPLVGDEIGVAGLAPVSGPGVGDRAWVGRVLGLRRRKGMVATVAHGATAATGWASFIEEGRPAVSATRSLLAGDGAGGGTLVDIRGRRSGEGLREPWSRVARSVSIAGRPVLAGVQPVTGRSVAPCHRTPLSVAVSLWRLQSYPVIGRCARPAADAPSDCAGRAFRFDPLGRDTRLFATATDGGHALGPPQPWQLPLPLTLERLEELLGRAHTGRPPPLAASGCERFAAGDLRDWKAPASASRAAPVDAIVDPVHGRLLLTGEPRERVRVDYAYGFPGQLGGGPYGTPGDYATSLGRAVRIQVGAGEHPGETSLDAALAAVPGPSAAIVIEDSATYVGPWEVTVPAGSELRIASAPEAAPVLEGDLLLRIERGSRLELSGLTVAGEVTVHGDGDLVVEHCALADGAGRPSLSLNGSVAAVLDYAIVHGVKAGAGGQVTLRSSVIDGSLSSAGTAELERVTALGRVRTATLLAGDCLFREAVEASDGLIQTSYVAGGSSPPQLLQCLGPEVGIPRFTSTRWGDPAYCQLHLNGPRAIATGAARGGELGAYNWLGQPERFARLPIVLQELMPAGIGASVRYLS